MHSKNGGFSVITAGEVRASSFVLVDNGDVPMYRLTAPPDPVNYNAALAYLHGLGDETVVQWSDDSTSATDVTVRESFTAQTAGVSGYSRTATAKRDGTSATVTTQADTETNGLNLGGTAYSKVSSIRAGLHSFDHSATVDSSLLNVRVKGEVNAFGATAEMRAEDPGLAKLGRVVVTENRVDLEADSLRFLSGSRMFLGTAASAYMLTDLSFVRSTGAAAPAGVAYVAVPGATTTLFVQDTDLIVCFGTADMQTTAAANAAGLAAIEVGGVIQSNLAAVGTVPGAAVIQRTSVPMLYAAEWTGGTGNILFRVMARLIAGSPVAVTCNSATLCVAVLRTKAP